MPETKISTITYDDLRVHRQANFTGTPTTWNSNISALNNLLGSVGKDFSSAVGPELNGDFANAREKALEHLQDGSRHAQRSYLKGWKESYEELLRSAEITGAFGEVLQKAFRNTGAKIGSVAKRTGIAYQTLYRWAVKGGVPLSDRHKDLSGLIHRLERELDLPVDALMSRVPSCPSGGRVMNPFSRKQKERGTGRFGISYSLRSPWPERMEVVWKEFFRHKTTEVLRPGEKRPRIGVWRTEADGSCPSAAKVKRALSASFGFLTLPLDASNPLERGLGIPVDHLCMSMLVDIDKITAYLNFVKMRSGNDRHSANAENFITMLLMLMHPETGFLTQNRKLLPPENQMENDEAWRKYCAETFACLKDASRSLIFKASHDPYEIIEPILGLPSPIKALVRMNDAAMADFEKRWGDRIFGQSAIDYRNILISCMLTIHPLRVKNISRLTYHEDGTGHLRKVKTGTDQYEWRFFIPSREFKNEKGAASEDYKVLVHKSLWPMIETYLEKYRPVLLKKLADKRFFVGKIMCRNKGGGGIKTRTVQAVIEIMSAEFCKEIPWGIHPHAYRHIVATDILKADPTKVEVAAAVLHDRPETIRRAYAHLLVGDKTKHFHAYVDKIMAEMQGDK